MEPPATPMLPPRNVHALITPAPAPARSGGRAVSARRGAVAYGTARPIPIPNKPVSSNVQIAPADPIAIAAAASAVRIVAALRTRRGPQRSICRGAEKAAPRRPPLIGSRDRPARTGLSASPVELCAYRL